MNAKKRLENRVSGWLPNTSTLPHHHAQAPMLQSSKLTNPLPPLLENRFQRNSGIVIGMGIGLLLIGLGGALIASSTYNEVRTFFSYTGVDENNYLYRHLIEGVALNLTIAAAGALFVLFGGVSLRSQTFRELSFKRAPYTRLGNFLFGFGTGLTVLSFRNLFTFFLAPNNPILNHNNIQLWLFAAFFTIGASLVIAGLVTWKRNKRS